MFIFSVPPHKNNIALMWFNVLIASFDKLLNTNYLTVTARSACVFSFAGLSAAYEKYNRSALFASAAVNTTL
jgi:hypothetical protein